MIHMTDETVKYYVKLAGELRWLKENHPEQTALIALAENHIKTYKQATSCGTFDVYSSSGRFGQLDAVMKSKQP